MQMPILTKKDQTMNGGRRQSRRVTVSVLSVVNWCVWCEAMRISCTTWKSKASKRTIQSTFGPEPVHVETLLTWQNTLVQ